MPSSLPTTQLGCEPPARGAQVIIFSIEDRARKWWAHRAAVSRTVVKDLLSQLEGVDMERRHVCSCVVEEGEQVVRRGHVHRAAAAAAAEPTAAPPARRPPHVETECKLEPSRFCKADDLGPPDDPVAVLSLC